MFVLSEPEHHPSSEFSCGTVEERLALVERVACSAAFSKSVRLRDFLRYVGQRAARTNAAEVHEQEIGEKVFGRSHDYDRSQDNIVRVNATDLRRRIDTYFATEGADDQIAFSIPRGSYMPVFRQHFTIAEKEQSDQITALDAKPPRIRSYGVQPVLIASAMLLLVGVCGFLLWQNARLRKEAITQEKQPTVDAFWASMINAQRNTDIVLPDDSISLEEEMTGKRIALKDYTDRNFVHNLDVGQLSPDRAFDVQLALSHNLVTLGGFYAALRIRDMQPRSTSVHLAWARFYSAESMKRDNVVLIGGAKANPWVDLYEDRLNFNLDYNNPTHSLTIQNRHRQSGEAASYREDESFGYSVVAYLPNPSNKGNVILLMGSDSDASNAAAEYLTSEENLNKLLQTFHRKSFPHFELLLQVSRVRGTSLAANIVAYRIYS